MPTELSDRRPMIDDLCHSYFIPKGRAILIILTSGVYKVLWLFSPAVRTRLILSMPIQTLPTEQPPTHVMLSWLLSYFQAYQTLEGIIWFRYKVELVSNT